MTLAPFEYGEWCIFRCSVTVARRLNMASAYGNLTANDINAMGAVSGCAIQPTETNKDEMGMVD